MPQIKHAREQLRRMLQIRVHRDHGVASGRGQAGQKRRLMTKVPGESYVLDSRVLALQFLDYGQGAVGASVIYNDQFEGAVVGEGGRDALVKVRQVLFFIERRNYDRYKFALVC